MSYSIARVIDSLLRFRRLEKGDVAHIAALVMPALVGAAGLGTEYGVWVYGHQTMQSAADSGAVSAATAGKSYTAEADAVTATYGFVNGSSNTTVTANNPPKSGTYTANPSAVEVIITQQRARLFSAFFSSAQLTITARAVALPNGGPGCVIALDKIASGAVTVQGSTTVNLIGCSLYDNSGNATGMVAGGAGTLSALSVNIVGGYSGGSGITTTDGIHTNSLPTADPYANVNYPSFSGCDQHNYTAKKTVTINPGVYCGGIGLNAGANVTLNPGIYYLDQGSLTVNGGATLTGTGVTLVFTSSTGKNWATASINGGANVNLAAPTTGPTAGIALFADRNIPVGTTFKLNGGSNQSFGGAVYLSTAALDYTGNSNTGLGCTQVIADTITFTGNSDLKLNCGNSGTKSFGSTTAYLVE